MASRYAPLMMRTSTKLIDRGRDVVVSTTTSATTTKPTRSSDM